MSIETAEQNQVVIEREMAFPQEKVWRALTESDLMSQWMMPNDFAPAVGHRFQFRTQPMEGWNGIIESEVLAIDPPRMVSYRWDSMGLETTVVWTLAPTEKGTMLRMEQTFAGEAPERNVKGALYGWKHFYEELGGVLEKL